MSNPFDDHFSNDPLYQKRQQEKRERMAEEERIRDVQEQRKREKEAIIQAVGRYHALVVGVLGQLRDAMYPGMAINSLNPATNIAVNQHVKSWSTACWWELGAMQPHYSSIGYGMEPSFDCARRVGVGLQLDRSIVTNFLLTYYGEHYDAPEARPLYRTIRTDLTRESLEQGLIDLHKPCKRTEAVIQHMPKVDRVLRLAGEHSYVRNNKAMATPYQVVYRDPNDRLDWRSQIVRDPRLCAPPGAAEHEVDLGVLSLWYSEPNYYRGVNLVVVSLVFDATDTPIQYRCRVKGVDEACTVSLSEEALSNQLTAMLTSLFQQKTSRLPKPAHEAKKKRWWPFGS